jgi:uncharacterized protein (TIGR02118 family)
MIRIVFLLRRKPEMSRKDFQKYWLERHGPLAARYAVTLNILRYVQSHTIEDPLNDALPGKRGNMLEPYDGVAEIWYSSREDLVEAFSRKEAQSAGEKLLEDERRFIDLPNSPLWLAHEYPQINPTPENLVAQKNSTILKFYAALRHPANMSLESAQLYWRTTHGAKIRMKAQSLGIQRYFQVHRYQDELETALRESRAVQAEPFMGHAECWQNRIEMIAGKDMPERIEAADTILEDERRFIDFIRSAMWAAKEYVLIDRR